MLCSYSAATHTHPQACWTVGQYSKLEWTSKDAHKNAIRLVCEALKDKDLPVKLEASMAISRIVNSNEVIEFLRPQIGTIFEQFFLLFDEIGNEEVVATLGGLINQFQTDIIPFARQLFAKLVRGGWGWGWGELPSYEPCDVCCMMCDV
jgi:hypothetical protein